MSYSTVPLGEVCDIVGGGTPSKSVAAYYGGNIPWVTVGDMQGDFVEETALNITELGVQDSATNVIPEGNVIIATRVGLGKACILKRDAAINQDLKGIIPKKPKSISSRFLFWWFRSIAERIQDAGTGATVQGVKLGFVQGLRFPDIPLPEQQRIVTKLDAAFAALAEAQAHVERNRANARELFESYLNGVFEGKDWEMKRLQDVSLQFGRGKSKHRPRNDDRLYGGPYPFIQTGDVRNSDHVITSYSQTYSEFGLAQSKLWPKGTLCITIAANIAETAVLGFDACFPDSVIGMVADPKQCDIHYVEFLLQSFKTLLKAQGKGSAQDNINLGTFENQAFPFPPLAEQRKLAEALDAVLERSRQLESTYQQKLLELEGLKKGLLGAAFRGEL